MIHHPLAKHQHRSCYAPRDTRLTDVKIIASHPRRSKPLYFLLKIGHIEPPMPILTPDLPADLYQDLVAQFLAELMVVTQDEPTPEAFQRATQAYCDALRPWLEPGGIVNLFAPKRAL